jgi:predicted DNA-binding ribbon-helix-helix protein
MTKRKTRYEQLPESFLKYLKRYLKGFKNEIKPVQIGVVQMILSAPTRFRLHNHHEGSSFGWQELERKFGRNKFKVINERLGLFDIPKDAQGRDDWSKTEGRTKAFLLTDKVSDLRKKWLRRAYYRVTNLLTEDGDVIRNMPKQAIYAKRLNEYGTEVTREGWQDANLEPAVPINIEKLKLLRLHLEQTLYAIEYGFYQGGLFSPEPNPDYLEITLNDVRHILQQANNTVKNGYIIHRYQQSPSGRLYVKAPTSLQNVSRPVRQSALHGLWDYDIENCHYSILSQMAERHGYVCTKVNHYLANKKQVRDELASKFNIRVAQVKQALIALIYGAYFSVRPKDALPDILGSVELAKQFYAHPLFLELKDDIKKARSAILKAQVTSRQTIKNLRGLPMSLTNKTERQLLSHLLQGVEAMALESAHKLYPESIVLLQHDGWTSTKELDVRALEDAIFKATGYRLEVAGEPITCKLDDAFSDHPKDINPNQKLVDSPLKTINFEAKNVS